MSFLLFLSFIAYLATPLPVVIAQGTNAVCDTGYDWMTNSKGQNPCLISSFLFTPCSPAASSWVYPLQPGYHYNTPQNSSVSATACRCNTVLFSTISACAVCQGEEDFLVPWSIYSRNCSTVYIQKYPEDIPAGTAVPAWAYLDITVNNSFDPDAARALVFQNIPESTASAAPSSTFSSLTAPPSASGSSIVAPQAGDDNTSGKSTNTGAIVGAVVGAVVGLTGIGLAVFFYLRYRRNQANHNAPTGPLDLTADGAQYAHYPQDHQYGEKLPTQEVTQPLVSNQSPRLYDPNDPSTFPTAGDDYAGSMHASAYPSIEHTSNSGGYSGSPATGYQSSMSTNQNSAYRGAPEL